jgi:antitoxin component of RelBE/YafQ-DinJ toxin-antitoxin module
MKEYKNKEDNIRIRIDSGLKNRYQEYCDENGFSISKRIRLLLEKDLRGELKTVNNYDN